LGDPVTPPAILSELRVAHFRCIGSAELTFDPRINLFTGGNAAGKTSFLEAIYLLGRGRSFRAADNRVLIQSGQPSAEIGGKVQDATGSRQVGVRVAPGGLEIHIQGTSGGTVAELASALPVQAIHADIGSLVQGPPESRRRILDWGVFHVEHSYLDSWRRFRRTLAQRNSALREGAADAVVAAWDEAIAEAAAAVDRLRRQHLEILQPVVEELGRQLLDAPVFLNYLPGWAGDAPLQAALLANREGDRQAGYTRIGPHRADLRLDVAGEASRWRASRGQQKLLGAALVLAQSMTVTRQLQRPIALLVDEPAADLDAGRLREFLRLILAIPAQVFFASITREGFDPAMAGAMFHVEHGEANALL